MTVTHTHIARHSAISPQMCRTYVSLHIFACCFSSCCHLGFGYICFIHCTTRNYNVFTLFNRIWLGNVGAAVGIIINWNSQSERCILHAVSREYTTEARSKYRWNNIPQLRVTKTYAIVRAHCEIVVNIGHWRCAFALLMKSRLDSRGQNVCSDSTTFNGWAVERMCVCARAANIVRWLWKYESPKYI